VIVLAQRSGTTIPALLDRTIGATLRTTAEAHPLAEALVVPHQKVRLTYRQLDAAVDRLAAGLLDLGIEAGDRVGIWSPNRVEWVLVQFATARIGAILVTINPAYRVSELEYCLNQSECRMVFAASEFKTSDYRSMLGDVLPASPSVQHVIFFDTPEWEALASARDSDAVERRASRLHADEAINIQYTSGTTGFPKGATLSHRNILNNGYFVGERCGYGPGDRVCIPVPFYHCFGMVLGNLACITHGSTMVIPGEAFEPHAVLATVEAERCTSLYGVPTMFIAELADPGFDTFDLGSLRTGIMAGSPCPVDVMRQVIERMHMPEVTICYGMTETSPVSTQTLPDDSLDRRVGTVGTVHPHVEIKIIDPESGATVNTGATGEFCTRGYSVMLGYWNDPVRTAESIDEDGWMHSGDLAVMDEAGYVNIVGRIKDMIIRGGENIYPREIEEYLITHPEIIDAQVIGVPDEKYGEEVMAWIQLSPGSNLSEEDVRAFCKGSIAHYKVPRYVAIAETFPMTVTGKIQKYRLREMGIERLDLEAAGKVVTA
jgi:fatty-acyl-CoA synthase